MIIVTGGAGFIGSCLLWFLNKNGYDDILVVDHLDHSEKWKNLVGKRFRDYMEKDDFIGIIPTGRLGNKIEAIFHLGACSSTTCQDASYFIKNNYEYSKTLARFALEKNIRFIYASSAATYGNGEEGYSDDHEKLLTLKPLNIYGFSKHIFDAWMLRFGALETAVGLKYFNVFGPNEYHKNDMQSIVPKAFQVLKNEGVIRLFKSYRDDYKDGEQKRDFIYVKDAVQMTFFFLEHPSTAGIFNIGTGNAVTWNNLAKAMFKSLAKPAKIDYIDMPLDLRDKYQYYTQSETTKLRNVGYKGPVTSIDKSVGDYMEYLKNRSHL